MVEVDGPCYTAAFAVTGTVALVALAFWVRAPETLVRRTVEDVDVPPATRSSPR